LEDPDMGPNVIWAFPMLAVAESARTNRSTSLVIVFLRLARPMSTVVGHATACTNATNEEWQLMW